MIRVALIIIMCLSSLLGCSQQPSLHDANGKTIELSELSNKWVIINYWATWCHNCKKEIPALNTFYQKNKDHVVVLGVNYDDLQGKALKKAISQFTIAYPVLQENPAEILKLGDINVVPTTIVIDPQGKIAKRLLGPQTLTSLNHVIT